MINGHAHIDQRARSLLQAEFRRAAGDHEGRRAGDGERRQNDFKYADDFIYPPVKVDRVLRDGDTIRMGEVLLTAYHTPGHTRGATTWVANLVVDGKPYVVAFPTGPGSIRAIGWRRIPLPGHRRRLSPHAPYPRDAEAGHLAGAAQRILRPRRQAQAGQTEGVQAWIDPEGYRRFIAEKKRAFEDQVDLEMGVKRSRKHRARAIHRSCRDGAKVTSFGIEVKGRSGYGTQIRVDRSGAARLRKAPVRVIAQETSPSTDTGLAFNLGHNGRRQRERRNRA